jgi:hypothetical protein
MGGGEPFRGLNIYNLVWKKDFRKHLYDVWVVIHVCVCGGKKKKVMLYDSLVCMEGS